jgi:MtfA peptidase
MPGLTWYVIFFAVCLLIVWAVYEFRRKNHLLRSQVRGVPDHWIDLIQRNVPLYQKMPVDLQAHFQEMTMRFVEHKKFVPCGGLDEITEEMKVTIAANSALLVLNRPMRYPFHHVYSVLIYPTSFFNSKEEEGELMNGEAWPTGSVVVAWDEVKKSARDLRDGKNLVVHEFAHQLDLEDGAADGIPLIDRLQHRTWAKVLTAEFQKLHEDAIKGKRTVMDKYGADDPAEFFAVATEAFFARSTLMLKDHPELYEQLRLYYRVDPARWMAVRG